MGVSALINDHGMSYLTGRGDLVQLAALSFDKPAKQEKTMSADEYAAVVRQFPCYIPLPEIQQPYRWEDVWFSLKSAAVNPTEGPR